MSIDPLSYPDDGQRELQRLLKENRELRAANASLRVAAEAKSNNSCNNNNNNNGKSKSSTSSSSAAAALEKIKEDNNPSGESAGKGAVVRKLKEDVQHLKEELERAQREQQQAKEEYKQLKSVFESFVVEVCEREEAYKLVFARAYEEIEEQKKLSESLQKQLQERPHIIETIPSPTPPLAIETKTKATTRATSAATTTESINNNIESMKSEEIVTPPAPVIAGVDPSSLYELVDNIKASLGELEYRLGYNNSSYDTNTNNNNKQQIATITRKTTTSVAEITNSRGRRGKSRATVSSVTPLNTIESLVQQNSNKIQDGSHLIQQQQQQQQKNSHQLNIKHEIKRNTMPLITPIPGAGTLRTAEASSTQSTTTERKKRTRKKKEETEPNKRLALEPNSSTNTINNKNTNNSTTNAASLFESFTRNIEKPKGSEVNFGKEPIADYLGLLENTDNNSSEILRRELLNFCASDINILASYIVEYFLSKSALSASVVTLWKNTERVMKISRDIFTAFTQKAVKKLIHLLGPDTSAAAAAVDNNPQLKCLALVLRIACALRLRDSLEGGADILFIAFYECTVSALRTWRIGGSSGDNQQQQQQQQHQHVLIPWMITVHHMCGFVEDFHMVIRYYANSERVLEELTLPKSLTRYAVQAVMSSCYFNNSLQSTISTNNSERETNIESWIHFCDAMDWSYSAIPLDKIGAAAAKILAHTQEENDSHKRGEALLTLRLLILKKGFSFLQSLTEELRISGGEVDVDTAFAELFSLAVMDLQLEDPRDEQWGRAMAFFIDYLNTSSIEQVKSAAELIASCRDTHIFVLRAILQLCHGSGVVTEESVEYISKALSWVKALYILLEREGKSGTVLSHPFLETILGREMLYICQQQL